MMGFLSTKTPKSICYVAGKSGGHIIPALTLARQYQEHHASARILFFSTADALDKKNYCGCALGG